MYEISVVSYQGQPPADPISAVFGHDGGTLGRGLANTLVLADPNRFVSRLQAKVTFDGDRLVIENSSSANPLLVNDRELEAGAKAVLADSDELRVGLYLLRVRAVEGTATELPRVREAKPPDRASHECFHHAGPAAPATSPVSLPAPLPNSIAQASIPPPLAGGAGPGPLDPLQLLYEEEAADPFADLLPQAPASNRIAHSGGRPPETGANHILSERAPIPLDSQRPVSAPALRNDQRVDKPLQTSPSAVSPLAVAVPDQVWDELARVTSATQSVAPSTAPPPADFDAFAEPSAGRRNAEDPLSEFAHDAITLDSLGELDTPIETLFADAQAHDPLMQDIIPDPQAAALDPLAGQDTVDPMLVFEDPEAKSRASGDSVFKRSESDHVPELEAFFRPPEARFEPPAKTAADTDDSLERNPTELVPPSQRVSPRATFESRPLESLPENSTLPDERPPLAVAPTRSTGPIGVAIDEPIDLMVTERNDERLLREFLAGAGIPGATVKEGLTPEMMKRIGSMLAAAVQGTIELIATRALLKREVKADVTIIATTRNNPLKFLPDAESALLQMFGSRIPGFMAPVEAMEDAFRDLRAHEVGVIAGMHAALAQVLQRFAPEELEKRLKPPGILEGLLPNSHKARLWESFAEMYVDISREAQDDFQSLFGKAFLQAYENEISRLKGK